MSITSYLKRGVGVAMVVAGFSLVIMVFYGAQFDDPSRLMISTIFAVVFWRVFEHYFHPEVNKFYLLSAASFIPYIVWAAMGTAVAHNAPYDFTTLMKIAPAMTILVIGLDTLFLYMRNKPPAPPVPPPPVRPRQPMRW